MEPLKQAKTNSINLVNALFTGERHDRYIVMVESMIEKPISEDLIIGQLGYINRQWYKDAKKERLITDLSDRIADKIIEKLSQRGL